MDSISPIADSSVGNTTNDSVSSPILVALDISNISSAEEASDEESKKLWLDLQEEKKQANWKENLELVLMELENWKQKNFYIQRSSKEYILVLQSILTPRMLCRTNMYSLLDLCIYKFLKFYKLLLQKH
jgi:hypothetical protein